MRRRSVRRSTVPRAKPPKLVRPPAPPPTPKPPMPPRSQVAHIVDDSEASLLDVLDNLLNRGVVLNADLILALANVDLVYVRLSALLCAADRLLSHDAGRRGSSSIAPNKR